MEERDMREKTRSMWHLYIFMALLASSVVLKLVHPLMGRGRFRHGATTTAADAALTYALVAAVPVLSLGVYLFLGRPDLQGRPAVFAGLEEMDRRHAALLAEKPLATLVTENPHDIGALISLAQVNSRLGNPDDSVRFYARAVAEAQKQDDWRLRLIAVALGETQVKAAGGRVSDDAVKTFSYVLDLHPENPFARFYLAQRKAEDGDVEAAIGEMTTLLNEGVPGKFWKKQVREKIAELRKITMK